MTDQPFLRFFVIVMLIAIVVSLGMAFRSLLRNQGKGTGTVKALTIRVALSIALFILLLVLTKLGIIKPH
jgi:Na+-driven multidrug efflux pump